MSAKKFKFVSPGVFLSEIDNSQIPKEPGGIGPVVIGRTRQGPAMKPVKVSSFKEFVEIFGDPVPGNEGEDTWRDGNGLLATAYAPYAAQAYLKANINSPVTVVRLLGVQGDDADDTGHAGWEANAAFGIFVAPGVSGSHTALTASLVGVVYSDDDALEVGVEGQFHNTSSSESTGLTYADISGSSEVKAVDISSDAFTIALKKGSDVVKKSVSFRRGTKYIRDRLNTNPVATNTDISSIVSGTLNQHYWLGETYEETYEELKRSLSTDQKLTVFTMALDPQMADFKSSNHQLDAAVSGWVIPQHVGESESFDTANLEKLFRFHAIQEGERGLDLSVQIENIKIAETGNPSPFGRFDIVVKQRLGDRIYTVDSFENLNLNPNSDNFIARRIGDQYFEWDPAQKRNKVYGSYPNNSSHIRVELGGRLAEGQTPDNPRSVPFGFFGPVKPVDRAEETATTASFHNDDSDWVTGSTAVFGSTGLRVQWPVTPHVTSGSTGIDLQRRYIMGSTPFNKEQGTNYVNYVDTNTGMKDYLRKYSSFGSLVAKQTSGIADGTATVHSYVFSLDEVVISGATAPGADLSSYNPTAVDFVAGSHAGTTAAAAVPGAPATATITFDTGSIADFANDVLGNLDGKGFTLFDTTGTTVPFVFSDAVSHEDGREVVSDGVNKVVIGINGCANADAIADRIENTINALDGSDMPGGLGGHNRTLAVTAAKTAGDNSTFTITLTQDNDGAAGNGQVTQDEGLLNLNGDSNADLSISSFGSGVNQVDGSSAVAGTAYTSLSAGGGAIELLRVVNSFSMPLVGGCDGVDITEADPFNMSSRTVEGKTTRTSYAYASIDRAIELMKDPEALETNLAVMPGITNTSLTTKLVQTCEARADALAIIDLPNIYIPPAQDKCTSFRDRVDGTTPEASARDLVARQLNSSYGATYYPWVKVRDVINTRDVWVPPSVVALGVMAYTEQRDAVWFAPAGFNRGGLNEGNAGLPVLQVSEQLLSSQRDTLYEANINPIASFVSEGLVVFGQKTLQMTPSALDRINVRRLLIFVKKQISRIANGLLFDQNVPATWNRFTGQVVPFLEGVKTSLGLTDFKVVLDRTTTTPDLVDRNVMYAKIFLKPARAIEFIAVDFVITRTGASFDD
jgi:hypothetical protein